MTGSRVPPGGELRLGSVTLPPGQQIISGMGSRAPVAWATIQPVADPGFIWAELSAASPDNGLMPFLLAGLDETTMRPWDNQEFGDPADVTGLDHMDPFELLAQLWDDEMPLDEEDDEGNAPWAPFSNQFPGLAPAEDHQLSQQQLQEVLGSLPPARIGLAPAPRPADVLPLIGWQGTDRWENALVISAVLRSWEERFGANLLQIGFAEIRLLVRRPPRTAETAQRLAAEHFAFCDESAGVGLHSVLTITDYLLKSPIWTCWWD